MNSAETKTEIYDLRGLNCPLPVLKARKRLSEMTKGAQLWVETTDPLAVIDVPHFCREAGHTLVKTETVTGGHRFLIQKL
ncbi:MAG: sulfurtransferase TusA family protein [Notoacmeibacter sp.]